MHADNAMNCRICNKPNSWVPHHVSYGPEEIIIYVCLECHHEIHFGKFCYLAPGHHRMIDKVRPDLTHLAVIAGQTKIYNRQQWKKSLGSVVK